MNEVTEIHKARMAYSTDRVLDRSDRSRNEMKTVGWSTLCTCGEYIKTKGNQMKAHQAKVNRHNTKHGA